MSYCIEYEPHKNKLYPKFKVKKQRNLSKIIICITVLLAVVFACRAEPVRGWLIPGDPQVTSAAFSSMVEQMKQGASVQDAVTAFCVQVINGSEDTY